LSLKSFLKGIPGIRSLVDLRREVMAMRHDLAAIRQQSRETLAASSDRFVEQLLATPRYADARHLARHELTVHSQGGEDGVIAEIFRRIGTTDRFFVEFGVESGVECNTTLLLRQGWRGVWFEGNPAEAARARELFAREISEGRLTVVQAFVTRENAAQLMADAKVPATFDLLSLDIDRNTWHLWEALSAYRARVTVVEYNAAFGPHDDWVIDYDAQATWDGSVRFGASLAACERLGRSRGDALVGCALSGNDAFFVRESLAGDLFAWPYTSERHWEPPRYWLHWRRGHPSTPTR
jgi:hypothetical protein